MIRYTVVEFTPGTGTNLVLCGAVGVGKVTSKSLEIMKKTLIVSSTGRILRICAYLCTSQGHQETT